MIGKKAPAFSCQAVVCGNIEDVTLDTYQGKYKVLFFYPLDFTFVCPTELHAFQAKLPAFEQRGVQLIGCSVDSPFTHAAWLRTPKREGGIEGVAYPLLADMTKKIAREYGVLDEDAGVAYRGVFVLDKDDVVQSVMVNNLSLGRNVDEVLRIVDALQFVEKNGQVCPANWTVGSEGMEATDAGVRSYFKS